MPANLENSAVATGLEKVSFHSGRAGKAGRGGEATDAARAPEDPRGEGARGEGPQVWMPFPTPFSL